MDLKNAETKVEQADSLLTKLKNLLKKHWGFLLLLLFLYGVYKFCVLVGEEMDKTPAQEQQDRIADSIYFYQTYSEDSLEEIPE